MSFVRFRKKRKRISVNSALPTGVIQLFHSKMGQQIRIHSLPKGKLRAYFIRLGIREGENVKCYERLPGGTIVIQKNRQEIAIGHELAKQILVVIVNDGKS